MKKLVYIFMAIFAIGFASCDKTTSNNQDKTQETTVVVTDSTQAAPANEDQGAVTSETETPAENAEAPAPEEKK